MNGVFDFIITTDKRYNNVLDSGLIVNTEITERDAVFTNRIGEVVLVPRDSELGIQEGDKIVTNHNIFRRWYDIRGKAKNGSAFLDEDTYVVEPDLIYAYKHDDKWNCPIRYTFIKPIEAYTDFLSERISLLGEIVICNDWLRENGVKEGDWVWFQPDSDYEFYIDEQLLYRVMTADISIKLNESEKRKIKINQERASSSG